MSGVPDPRVRRAGASALEALTRAGGQGRRHLETFLGGPLRARVIFLLAGVLALSSADLSTVGASATQLRHALHIDNTDIGLLVAANSLVAAVASVPFGVLADRVPRTRTLGLSVVLWGVAMVWSATVHTFGGLLLTRLVLGVVTASAGPVVASLIGDLFPSAERGRIYGYVLTGELLGAGAGFAVTGDIAALSWRAAFLILAVPAFALAWAILHLPEPARGGATPLLPGATRFPRPGEVAEGLRADTGVGTGGRPATGGDAAAGTDTDPQETDAQRIARERGITADRRRVLRGDARRMKLLAATRYVLGVRTNMILILSSALGYYFLAGVQTFGAEFVKEQYSVNQALANLLMLVIGAGAVGGVLAGGALGDGLLRRRYLNARILVAAVAATLTTVLFVPALLTRGVVTALPYLTAAAFLLSAQNPPIDAARLDIMPPLLWGRAEGIRTLVRTAAQALAPVLFGAVSDSVFGGGRSGLQWTFTVMLLPLAASAYLLFRAMRTYPSDVATAAAAIAPVPADGAAAARPGTVEPDPPVAPDAVTPVDGYTADAADTQPFDEYGRHGDHGGGALYDQYGPEGPAPPAYDEYERHRDGGGGAPYDQYGREAAAPPAREDHDREENAPAPYDQYGDGGNGPRTERYRQWGWLPPGDPRRRGGRPGPADDTEGDHPPA